MNMGEWKLVCRVADIPVLGARRIGRPQGMDVAVFRNAEGGVFALLDRCPHKGGPLSQGIVFGTSVACPLHNWTVGLDDGCARQPDEGRTPKFRVKVEDGAVYLDAVELASLGIDAAKPVAGPERCSRPASTPSSVVPSNARTQGVPDTEERSGFPPSRE